MERDFDDVNQGTKAQRIKEIKEIKELKELYSSGASSVTHP